MKIRHFSKISLFFVIGISLISNNGYGKKPSQKPRTLLRKAQMGVLTTPPMPLVNDQVFDFKFAANAQFYYVLKQTESFYTAGSGLDHDLVKMDENEKEDFFQCREEELSAMSMHRTAACMIEMPQIKIDSWVESLELKSELQGWVALEHFANFGSSAYIKKSILTMDFQANDPLIERKNIAASRPTAKRKELKVKGEVKFGEISMGAGYYYSTPLAKVLNTAMNKGISKLKDQMDLVEEGAWYAMVKKNCDDILYINAGEDAKLKVGDQLAIYNVLYDWEGAPCDSALRGSSKESDKPIAIVEIFRVGDTFSIAKYIQREEVAIIPGARAYLHQFHQ